MGTVDKDKHPDWNVDLSGATNPRALNEAETAFFAGYAEQLAPGENRYVPYTGGRLALVRLKSGVLGLVDLYEKTQAEDAAPAAQQATKSARKASAEAKLDADTADLFRERTAKLKPGQSIVLPGGATIRKDSAGNLWMTA